MARPAARAPKPSAPLESAVRSETVKHYAETIFYIRQEEGRVRPGRLAEWLGVGAPTVTVTLQRLARDGFVEIGGDRSVTLTPAGEDLAAKIVRGGAVAEEIPAAPPHARPRSPDRDDRRPDSVRRSLPPRRACHSTTT